MTKTPFLSIIIPCYNASATIVETLDCFVSQFSNFNSYEIIVIDDGSFDNSVHIVREYSSSNSKISVHTKANGGVSSARNYGLKKATGTYVWFFDADDLLFDNAIEQIIKHLESYNPDILRFNSVTVDAKIAGGIDELNNSRHTNLIYKGNYSSYLKDNTISFACWSHILKRDLLIDNGILFDETLPIHEDVVWGLTLAQVVPQAMYYYINLLAVKYMVRNGSIVNTVNSKANKKHLTATIRFNSILNNMTLEYGGGT